MSRSEARELRTYDFAVIGAGIAGASVAYELQSRGRTLLLEREPLPGHHTTGRSAAFSVESYGNHVIRLLTRAGRAFLEDPPEGFARHRLVERCPVLWIARSDQAQRLAEKAQRAAATGAELSEVSAAEAHSMCPVLREEQIAMGLVEDRALHIDVAGLLDGYLAGFRARGGELATRAAVTALSSIRGGWEIRAGNARHRAGVIVNAAGAWAEEIGALAGARPIGLVPLRRTVILFEPPDSVDIAHWPCLIDADEAFYLKPEGARLLASPCDETPFAPCDVTPDELQVALAADRVMRATTLEIRHIQHRWAGLRSFVADRAPVIGMDLEVPGLCWLAGQGGSGIMTAPSAARAAAALIVDGALPEDLKALGITPEMLAPSRPALRSEASGS
jgi:D-arginine dehydrogenase